MVVHSEYVEEKDSKKPPLPVFTDPQGFLGKVLEFTARETDLFKSNAVVQMINKTLDAISEKNAVEVKDEVMVDVIKAENVRRGIFHCF